MRPVGPRAKLRDWRVALSCCPGWEGSWNHLEVWFGSWEWGREVIVPKVLAREVPGSDQVRGKGSVAGPCCAG